MKNRRINKKNMKLQKTRGALVKADEFNIKSESFLLGLKQRHA